MNYFVQFDIETNTNLKYYPRLLISVTLGILDIGNTTR